MGKRSPFHITGSTTRRDFLVAATGVSLMPSLAFTKPASAQADTTSSVLLKTTKRQAQIAPEPYNQTPVWCYNNSLPGPEIRVKQGERLKAIAENTLDEETTVHWHGVRVPNAMDGVSHLTQQPISTGSTFTYEFDATDAGTFWYHPHQGSSEQLGRGLYGPLIVEEAEPIKVDRDITWMLDDWRLTRSAEIRDDFANRHDMSHGGRIGNTVTINGVIPSTLSVQQGERIRLRLINAANARIFALDFRDHNPVVIALDGQPVSPHAPENGYIVLGPAMRADVVIDMTGTPGSRHAVHDIFYQGREYQLMDIVYADTAKRKQIPDWSMDLKANALPEPDVSSAVRHTVEFTGGMMGGRVMQQMGIQPPADRSDDSGSMMEMMHANKMWFINGVAAEGHVSDPLLILKRDGHYVLEMVNATAWHHPIHLHGHSFRVLSRSGKPTAHREWQDTVLMNPRERVEIAFVADNPGDWMFHCHVLEHMAAGMMGVIRVA